MQLNTRAIPQTYLHINACWNSFTAGEQHKITIALSAVTQLEELIVSFPWKPWVYSSPSYIIFMIFQAAGL